MNATATGDFEVLAGRLLGGEQRSMATDEALRRWFRSLSEIPPAAYEATSPALLLSACGQALRPRALELHDLLAAREGRQAPPPVRPPCRLWVMLDRGGDAIALRLTCWKVAGPAGLAADVRHHAGAERDEAYRWAEAAACRVLEDRHPGAAVRYSLQTADGEPYLGSIEDGSLGAALGVAALEACGKGRFLVLGSGGAVTGSLGSDGKVGTVAQRSLRAKAVAAGRAGARKLVVPREQGASLPGIPAIRIREAGTVEEARRRLSTLRPAAFVLLAALLLLIVVGALFVRGVRSERQVEQRREVAAARAMTRAVAIADSDPREALGLTAAAGLLAPRATAAGRSLVAATLPPDLRFLPSLPAPASAVSWTEDGILAATADRLFELDRAGDRWIPGRRLPQYRLAAFDGGGQFVIGGREGAFALDLATDRIRRLSGEPVRRLAGNGGTAVILERDGDIFAFVGLRSARLRSPVPVAAVAVSPRGELLAADGDGRILRQRGQGLEMTPGRATVLPSSRPAALADGGDQLLAAKANGAVYSRAPHRAGGVGRTGPRVRALLSLPGDRGVALRNGWAEVFVTENNYLLLRTEQRLVGNFTAAAVSPDGRSLLLAGRQAALLNLDNSLPSPLVLTENVAFDRSGHVLGLASTFGGVLRLGWRKPAVAIPQPGRHGVMSSASFSPNGRWALQTEPKGRVRLFDLWNRSVRVLSFDYASYDGPIEDFSQFAGVLNDGRIALSEDAEEDDYVGTTYIVDPREGKAERLDYNGYGPFALALPPGRLLLARGDEVDLVRIEDMERVARARIPGVYVTALAASARGGTVFFGTSSGDLWAWDPADGSRPRRLGQVDGAVISLVAAPAGAVLFGSANRSLRESAQIFAVDVGNANVKPLELPEVSSMARVALSPDGRRLAVSASLPVGAELLSVTLTPAEACARARGGVTEAQWSAAIDGLAVPLPACPGVR